MSNFASVVLCFCVGNTVVKTVLIFVVVFCFTGSVGLVRVVVLSVVLCVDVVAGVVVFVLFVSVSCFLGVVSALVVGGTGFDIVVLDVANFVEGFDTVERNVGVFVGSSVAAFVACSVVGFWNVVLAEVVEKGIVVLGVFMVPIEVGKSFVDGLVSVPRVVENVVGIVV